MINVPFLKLAFDEVIPMTTRAWNKLTHLWIGYFLLIALSNEVVRRTLTLDEWLTFKGWIIILTTTFGITALYLSYEPKEPKTKHNNHHS
jgi:intracellular septation protein A